MIPEIRPFLRRHRPSIDAENLSEYGFRMANEAQNYLRSNYPPVLKWAEYFRAPLGYDGLGRTFCRAVVWGGLALTIALVLWYVVFVLK